ncbi:fluoride efflux transporter FluC [Bombiscardovia coagulans]|uniref:fluoride efflux transporter FluC n=1 Tax=Bombiscardovia coagulans TaxID=686666 RepID=UPI003B848BDF
MLCGGLGAECRFMLDTSINKLWNHNWPLSTIVVNITAGCLAGLVGALCARSLIDPTARLPLTTGF